MYACSLVYFVISFIGIRLQKTSISSFIYVVKTNYSFPIPCEALFQALRVTKQTNKKDINSTPTLLMLSQGGVRRWYINSEAGETVHGNKQGKASREKGI